MIIPDTTVGVESAHAYGDALFNIPLILEISKYHNSKVIVTTKQQYNDAFENIKCIEKIININQMGDGITKLKNMKIQHIYQITQNITWLEQIKQQPNLSLIESPLQTAKQLGLTINPKPIFIPTDAEIETTRHYNSTQPTIAIEAEARSGQSWARGEHIHQIIEKYKNTHRILWLSITTPPQHTVNLHHLTRRQNIMCLRHVDKFYCVGSGLFCASLALDKEYQPKQMICLWDDAIYKYKSALYKYQWHDDLQWIDNPQQLTQHLSVTQ